MITNKTSKAIAEWKERMNKPGVHIEWLNSIRKYAVVQDGRIVDSFFGLNEAKRLHNKLKKYSKPV